MNPKTLSNHAALAPKKPPPRDTGRAQAWPRERILAEARKRARSIAVENSKQTQQMLADLCREAGWSDEDFLKALIEDVAEKGKLPGPPSRR